MGNLCEGFRAVGVTNPGGFAERVAVQERTQALDVVRQGEGLKVQVGGA
jgi:hypothetical protein